uniref:Uncharacterized protein n=1 Tax=Cajanus cajan TaxID=3821 RepID=A0A151TG09_CAJCA|nr:hypothetical protein KK1_012246 [Cajanus cajan]
MIKYGKEFYHRIVLHPKVMDFSYFATSGLYFHHHIEYQGLQHFVALKCDFFEDLIKVFYSNLRVSEAGFLYSDVNKTKIKIKPSDWLTLAGLKYQGHKLAFPNIPEEMQFDCHIALTSMIRLELQGRNVINVGSLNINDRLLHYVYVHILGPYIGSQIKDNHHHGQNVEDEDHAMPEDHGEEQPADITQQPPVQYDGQMFSQIWTGIQGLQEGLNNLTINVNQIHNRLDNLEQKFDDF